MVNSKLIQLLITFNARDWRRFEAFVSTPFFNKKEELIPYCQYLRKLAPRFKTADMDGPSVYGALYPNKSFDEKHLRYLNNYLLKLAEKYVGWCAIEEQPTVVERYTLQRLIDKKLYKHFSSNYKKTRQSLEEHIGEDIDYHREKLLLLDIASQEFVARRSRVFNPFLQAASNQLDEYYFLYKLKYCCSMLSWQSFISVEYALPFLEEVKTYLSNQISLSPEIKVYYHILQLYLGGEKETYFYQLSQLLETHLRVFPKNEQKEIYFHAINFCARKIRRGEEKYLNEALDLYEKGIIEEVLFENGYLSPWTYNNVVKLGLRLKKVDWTKDFIFQYKDKIEEQFQENAFAYNISELFYFQKDYDKAMEYLTQVKFRDVYHLSTRVILVKIYYETGAETALHSLISSFSIFLKRNKKISTNIKKTYLNFCEILHQILKKKKSKKDELKNKIETISLLTEKNWLLEVLEREL